LANVTADAIFFNQIANSTSTNPATMTQPGTYTVTSGAVTTKRLNGSSDQVAALGWRIVTATGTETPAWTTTTGDWTSAIAVYKAAAGGGAQDTPELRGPNSLLQYHQMKQLFAQ
jgi:hypothetical protein